MRRLALHFTAAKLIIHIPPTIIKSDPDSFRDEQDNGIPTPVVYEAPITVVENDIDGLGHANNVVYLRWVQDAATAHWLHSSTPQQQTDFAWVAIRHEIDYLKPAFLGDQLVARTYVGSVTGIRFERFVEISRPADSQLLAKSRSVWVAIDPASKRPKRIDPNVNRQFFVTTPHADPS